MGLLRAMTVGTSLGLLACTADAPPLVAPADLSRVRPTLALSSAALLPGGRVAVALRLTGSAAGRPDAVGALSGWIRFEPSALRYAGQPGPEKPVVITGERELSAGRLKLAVLDPQGLPEQAAVFVFEVLDRRYADELGFEVELAASRAGGVLQGWPARIGATVVADLTPPGEVRRLTIADWVAYFEPEQLPGPMRLPGDGFIFGDATLDGGLNVLDVLATQNAAAGNVPLLSLVPRDFAVAADVAPDNSPGLGEADDATPPGLEPDGTRVLNVLDALAIANAAAGNATPIAGRPIPGRTAASGRVVLSGTLAADRVLSRDTVYELNGTVRVDPGVTLTVGAGTRIEGQAATRGALVILRNGRIQALGTRLEPIVFTCTAAAPATGCWGGVSLNGSALLNNSDFGGGGTIGCPEKAEPGGSIYGGCLVEHSSGGMRFVRIERAGADWPGVQGPAPGLALNGVGSGTVLEDIQVLRSAGTGVFVSGGRAAMRELYLAQNAGDGLAWNDGWQGKAQAVLIARSGGAGAGLHGSNAAGNPTAGPRSHPTMYNVTILEIDPASPPALPAVLLQLGTGGVFRNVLVAGWTGTGLDINDAATCDRVGADSLDLSWSIFYGNGADFSSDTDCLDEVAYGTAPSRSNLHADPALLNPGFSASPDFRPANGSPAEPGAMPPSDGFFDVLRSYRGAVPSASVTRANIPWYAGWTVGF